jgi:hypothetical protein
MKNAYTILGVSQNADLPEIVKGQVEAMRAKKYSTQEIAIAKKQLSAPYQRLAVDFTFPVFESVKAVTVSANIQAKEIDINQIDSNAFDSLK